MAITSTGYEGTVDYGEWAELHSRAGSRYGVLGDDPFAASVGVGDRAVAVSAGEAVGSGILDVSDATVTLTGAPVASGSRWDLVALRRDWEAEESTLVLIQGSSSQTIPSRNTAPGVTKDDQPLWLVRFAAGQTAAQEFIDLRLWIGDAGLVAKHLMVRDYLTRIGAMVFVQGALWVYGFNTAGVPAWQKAPTPSAIGIQSGVASVSATGTTQVNFPIPFATPPVVTLQVLTTTGGVVSIPYTAGTPTVAGFPARIYTLGGARIAGTIGWTAVAQ